MAETLERPTPHTYLVAGGGGGLRSTIILRLLAQELTGRQLPYTVIEGISGRGESQSVRYPTLQVQDMEAHISQLPEHVPLLFISHCIGTVAALTTVERVADTRPAALVSIAPPLPSPYDTIQTPQLRKKRSQNDTLMRVIDLPEDALDYSNAVESQARIDPNYFDDINAAADLEKRLCTGIEDGRMAVFAPEYDWNIASVRKVQSWHEDWRTISPPPHNEQFMARALVVPNAAHGLYISPRSGIEVTHEEDLAFQRANVNTVIDTGLEMLAQAGQSADGTRGVTSKRPDP